MNYNISLTGKIMPIDGIYQGDLVEGDRHLSPEEADLYNLGYGYEIKNHELVDITQSAEYLKQERLKAIEQELAKADEAYDLLMATPVKYTNGFTYKPKYLQDSYVLLIAADIFPITIWDSIELNAVEMTKNDLITLSVFLKTIAEPAFQLRKSKRKDLIQEKTQLEK